MTTVSHFSLDNADAVEVEFLRPKGGVRSIRLLVDSGFTGQSSFVLPETYTEVFQAEVPAAETAGALQGDQNRAWVTCRIPGMSFERTLIAIATDISGLSLPPDIEGMVGLRFLRQFFRWGAERTEDGGWQFFLCDGEE